MFTAPQHRLKLLLALILLGILGDALLRIFPWGLGAFTWFALIVTLHIAYRRGIDAPMPPALRWALGAALLFALFIAWRDAPGLKVLNLFVVLTSIVIAAALAAERDLRQAWITSYFAATLECIGSTLAAPFKTTPQFSESIRSREKSTNIPFLSILRGIVYLWLALTFLRDRPRDFALGFLLSAYAAVFLLQAINPDAVITRTNIARFHDDKSFDTEYALSLSADAVPELVQALPTLPPYLQQEMRPAFENKWLNVASPTQDLRTRSWARHTAHRAIEAGDIRSTPSVPSNGDKRRTP